MSTLLSTQPGSPPPPSNTEKPSIGKKKKKKNSGPSTMNKLLGGLLCLSLWRKGPLCCSTTCSCFNDVESPEAERLRRETARHQASEAKWKYKSERAAVADERRREAEARHEEKVRRHREARAKRRDAKRERRGRKVEAKREMRQGKRGGRVKRSGGAEIGITDGEIVTEQREPND